MVPTTVQKMNEDEPKSNVLDLFLNAHPRYSLPPQKLSNVILNAYQPKTIGTRFSAKCVEPWT